MKKNHFRLLYLLIIPALFFAAGSAVAQTGANSQNDLRGENRGDDIWLWWSDEAAATQYNIIYRATSQNGPWQQSGTVDADMSRTGGPKIHSTSDARIMTLCYKIDALDTAGKIIRSYAAMCIQKFAG